MRGKLTRDFVNRLTPDPDESKRLTVWDTELPGFGITVTPKTEKGGGGVKSYVVQYRTGGRGTKIRRVTIGRHGHEWQPDSARKEAAEIIRTRRRGLDPFEERRRQREAEEEAKAEEERIATEAARFSYAAFCAEFVDRYAKKAQPASWRTTQRALAEIGRHLPADARVDTLQRDTISGAITSIHERSSSAAIEANKALKKLYSWATSETIFSWHPMRRMAAPAKSKKRKRVLSSKELKAVYRGAVALGYPYGFMVAGILATGLRRSDMAGLRKGEFYPAHEMLVIPGERMKREQDDDRGDFHFPLNSQALAIVEFASENAPIDWQIPEDQRPLFTTNAKRPISGFSKGKKALDKKIEELNGAPVAPWVLHDLRRTMSTVLQALGVDQRVIDLLQDHKIELPSKAASHYQHWPFEEEKRAAVNLYSDFLAGAIDDNPQFEDLVRKVDFKLMVRR